MFFIVAKSTVAILQHGNYQFVIISTIARIPSIVTSTIAGANIASGNWKNAIIIYIGIVAIVVLLLFIFNLFDKEKTTKTILGSIKK